MNLSKLCTFVLSLPKTIYFNFRTLKIKDAIKLPIFLSYKTKIIKIKKGIIVLPCKLRPFMIKIGAGGSPSLPSQKSSIRLQSGIMEFKGRASFGAGVIINLKGKLEIGTGFSANKNCFLSCTNRVTIGENVLLGWDCHIFDDNGGHHVYYNGYERKMSIDDFAISIGNHVWLCSYSHIMAGASVGHGSILGYKSLLTKKINEDNVLIVGAPAIVKQKNISWTI